ncbi:hypothetical protein JB92DRAFT_3128554 [Gautieria morchelliformis]|nr:hypothetical protein JB92DRAFT_3128554 [Gautieria morchelliformis]
MFDLADAFDLTEAFDLHPRAKRGYPPSIGLKKESNHRIFITTVQAYVRSGVGIADFDQGHDESCPYSRKSSLKGQAVQLHSVTICNFGIGNSELDFCKDVDLRTLYHKGTTELDQ